jgi:hypothetical protein
MSRMDSLTGDAHGPGRQSGPRNSRATGSAFSADAQLFALPTPRPLRRPHPPITQRGTRSSALAASCATIMNGVPPPRLWQEARNGDGRVYYYNVQTKATQWTKPEELMTPAEVSFIMLNVT